MHIIGLGEIVYERWYADMPKDEFMKKMRTLFTDEMRKLSVKLVKECAALNTIAIMIVNFKFSIFRNHYILLSKQWNICLSN